MATLILFPVVYDCFGTTAAELRSRDRERMAHDAENIYHHLALYRRDCHAQF